ncbi:MAG TPA: bacillithiol system redox-active protein YtxJ [Salinimicrobium sp.]|nr:bacillithiol system redox-active protein YtxJ [Salinimicrobium sp.]
MGLLDKVFKTKSEVAKEEIVEVPWNQLNDIRQLDTILEESKHQPVAIFKHSTRCGISNMVLKSFRREYEPDAMGETKLYFLDLLSNREISNEVANRFKVQHESPQLIILKDGEVVYHASHQGIKASSLTN